MTAATNRSRRLLLRLDRGSDLLPAVLDVCAAARVRSGQFQAVGWLDEVELSDYDLAAQRPRPPRRLGAPLQLLSLCGTIAEKDGALTMMARAVLSRESDNGVQVFGGLLKSARVHLCEVIIEAYEDLIVRRGADPRTGVECWTELVELPTAKEVPPERPAAPVPSTAGDPGAAPPPPAPPKELPSERPAVPAPPPRAWEDAAPSKPAGPGWDAVQRASQERDETVSHEPPKPGDLLDHHTYGRCTVERFEEDRDRISVRVRGRLVELSLEHLGLELAGREGHRRLFRSTKRR